MSHSSSVKRDRKYAYGADRQRPDSGAFGRGGSDTVYKPLSALLDAKVDHLCAARKYEQSEGHEDRRADGYDRHLQTKAGRLHDAVAGITAQLRAHMP